MSAMSIRAPRAQRLAVASGAAALAVMTLAAVRYGPLALGLPLAGVAAVALIQRARIAVGLVVSLMVLVEGSSEDFLGVKGAYNLTPLGVTPMECLLGLAILAVLLDRLGGQGPLRVAGPVSGPLGLGARGRPGGQRPLRVPRPLSVPLALVALATLGGLITGHFAGLNAKDLLFASRQMVWLPVVAVLVVNVVETDRQLRGALVLVAGLAIAKAAIGLAGVLAGVG